MFVAMLATGVGLTVAFLVARNRRRYVRVCYCATMLYAVILAGLSAFSFYVLLCVFPAYFAEYPSALRLLLPLFVFANLLYLFHNHLLTGLQCFARYFWMNVLHSLTLLAGIVVLGWTDNWSVSSAFSIWIISLAVPLPWQATAILRRFEGPWPRRQRLVAMLRLLAMHAVQSSVATISDVLVFRSGVLILRVFSSFSVVGAYAIACSVSELILHLPKGLSVFLLPRLAASRAGVTGQIVGHYRLVFCLLVVLACVAAAVTPVIPLFLKQPEYAASAGLARILLIGTTMMGWGMLVASHMRAAGDMRAVVEASLLAFVVVLGCSLLLIPPFHAYGASVAATLAFASYGAYAARWLGKSLAERRDCHHLAYAVFPAR
jgi:O-antigen/teichoic acid export membrane protein